MSERRYFLDRSPGERRAVVTLDGRPERLFIERDGEGAPRLGARYAARVRRVDRVLGMAFLDLGGDGEAVAALGRASLGEGQAVEVEITAEPRRDKAAIASVHGPATSGVGLLQAGPTAAERLEALADGGAIVEGDAARQAADEAEEAVLVVEHSLPGGGTIAIEPTRALVAIDVDQGTRGGQDRARVVQQTNLTAIREGARLLRLKGLGGLVVFDLVGQGQAGEALAAEAKRAFATDQPGVVIGPVSRLGTLTLALPQRRTPVADLLLDSDGRPSARSVAQRLVREVVREGRSDPGALFDVVCAPDVAEVLQPLLIALGPRFDVTAEVGRARSDTDIRRR